MKRDYSLEELAKMIDHSLLRPELTHEELIQGLEEALLYDMASASVRPCDVLIASKRLTGSNVFVGTVVGFPHGAHTTETKVFEAMAAMDECATEIDMVMNIGRFRSGQYDFVQRDIGTVVEVAHARSAIVKVILENHFLTQNEIVKACQLCEQVGADFVKTSTGYAPSGAKLEDVALMRRSCNENVEVKAAGGIRDLDQMLEFITAGATRIATRSSVAILEEARNRLAASER
jgi:deoxyribose-phosphate aldolase